MAFNDTRYRWVPPSVADLDFTNCTALASWSTNYFNSKGDVSVIYTIEVLRDGLQGYWNAFNISRPTGTDLLSWFVHWSDPEAGNDNSIILAILDSTERKCFDEFCKQLPFQGQSDLAGRGMIASYVLQASLVTICVFIPLISLLQWDNNLYLSRFSNWAAPLPSKRRKVCHAIHRSIRESTRALLDASLLLCTTILVAATYRIGKPAFRSNEGLNTFEVLASAFVALYSICPAIAVHLRRKKARTAVWILVAALTILMMGFYYYSRWHPWNIDLDALSRDWVLQDDPDHQVPYEIFCSIGRDPGRLLKDVEITTGFAATLAGIVLFYLTFILALDHIPGVRNFHPLQILRTHWHYISSLLALIATWTMLGFIIDARKLGKRISGETNKAHQWTLGQIISLATFLPVLIEFLYGCVLGTEKALTGLMSKYYHVTKSLEPPKQAEMDRTPNGNGKEDSKIEDGGV